MIKVLALTKYSRSGPSSRYRYYNYKTCFQNNGLEMAFSPFFPSHFFAKNSKLAKLGIVFYAYFKRFGVVLSLLLKKQYSLIIIEYELFPYFFCWFERLLKLRGVRYIVDYDDAVFHRYDNHSSWLIQTLFANKIKCVMKNASLVIVGNDYLKQYAQKVNDKILQLPTVVLLHKYIEEHKNPYQFSNENRSFIIGWIGSKSTSTYLLDLLPVMEKIASLYDVQFNLIGFDADLISSSLEERCKIKAIKWTQHSEISEMMKFDVGIMPLPDDDWAKGKCGFKLIQYMSCKKPVIASPIGVNCTIIEDGINGFLATSHEQWLMSFQKLYEDMPMRKAMSDNNWKKIQAHYHHKDNCLKYIEAICKIVEKKPNV